MRNIVPEVLKLMMVVLFAAIIIELMSCAMSEERQIEYDACKTDDCRLQAERNDREDKKYAYHERKVEAYERFIDLPRLCGTLGMMMTFRCDAISRVCGRKRRNIDINDYTLSELTSAGCVRSIRDALL